MDRIGLEGIKFNNGYAASASCSPSRASIMTGRYSTRFGFEFTPAFKSLITITKWGEELNDTGFPIIFDDEAELTALDNDGNIGYPGMPSSEITIPEVLKNEGYYTAINEADELCASMVINGFAWACLSEDMDMFVYGCTRV